MKLRNKLLFGVGAVTAVAAVAATVLGKDKNGLPENFTLTAHTGCEGTKDNSLAAITVGYVSGADVIEFDLNFNKDGVAVLSHNEPTGDEVTLDEAFAHLEQFPTLKINVDVKNTLDLKQVVECAEKHNLLDRMFYTGIREEDVEAVINSTPDVMYYLNVDVDLLRSRSTEYINELVEKVREAGAVGINMRFTGASPEFVNIFHENGLQVSLWTVNNRFDMKKVLSYGADNITTRKPSVYKDIIREVTGEASPKDEAEYF